FFLELVQRALQLRLLPQQIGFFAPLVGGQGLNLIAQLAAQSLVLGHAPRQYLPRLAAEASQAGPGIGQSLRLGNRAVACEAGVQIGALQASQAVEVAHRKHVRFAIRVAVDLVQQVLERVGRAELAVEVLYRQL